LAASTQPRSTVQSWEGQPAKSPGLACAHAVFDAGVGAVEHVEPLRLVGTGDAADAGDVVATIANRIVSRLRIRTATPTVAG
jgi:hypothetical protein